MKQSHSHEGEQGGGRNADFCHRLTESATDPQTANAWESLLDEHDLTGLSPTHGPAESSGRHYSELFHTLDRICATSTSLGARKMVDLLTDPHVDKKTGEVTHRLRSERLKGLMEVDPEEVIVISRPIDSDVSGVDSSAEFSFVPMSSADQEQDGDYTVVTLSDLTLAAGRYDATVDLRVDDDDQDTTNELEKITLVVNGISPYAVRNLDIDGVPVSLTEKRNRARQEDLTYEELLDQTDSEFVWADLATAWRAEGYNLPALLTPDHSSVTPSVAEVVAARKQLDEVLADDPEAVAASLADETGAISYLSLKNFVKRTGINPRDVLLYAYGPETTTDHTTETVLYTSPVMPDQEDSVTGRPIVVTLEDLATYSNGSGKLTLNPDQTASPAGISVIFGASAEEIAAAKVDNIGGHRLELTERALKERKKKKKINKDLGHSVAEFSLPNQLEDDEQAA